MCSTCSNCYTCKYILMNFSIHLYMIEYTFRYYSLPVSDVQWLISQINEMVEQFHLMMTNNSIVFSTHTLYLHIAVLFLPKYICSLSYKNSLQLNPANS